MNYQGFTPAARAAFQGAVNYWAATLSTPVTITVDALFGDLGHNQNGNLILGGAGPAEFVRDFPGAPLAETWYPIALANRLHGSDLDTANSDIQAVFTSNPAADFYFGTDNHAPANTISFESVVMHELGHGLGFADSFNDVGGVGSFGLSGFPDVYDRLVVNGAGTHLISLAQNSTALGAALVSPTYLQGTKTPKSRAFSPNPYLPGSSIAHLDEATFPRGNPNSLMTPAISPGENIATVGPIVLAVFKDLGWSVPLGTAEHDVTGDRNNDFVARNPDGSLFTYGGTGVGGILPALGVSTIFNQFSNIALSADWNGDNVPDLIGKRPDGTWWLLLGNGIGKYAAPIQMGSGGTIYNTFLAPGDFNGDTKPDVLARKKDGTLVMLPGNGAQGFGAVATVGSGFAQYNLLLSPGDWNGDKKSDLLARTTAGKLMFFAGTGDGHLGRGAGDVAGRLEHTHDAVLAR